MSKVSRLDVIQTGARRRWTLEEKLRIVAESAGGPRMVSATARRHGLSVNQLFVWRRLVREGRLGGDCVEPSFVPAIVGSDRTTTARANPESGRIEIVLSRPRHLIVDGSVDPAALTRLITMLELP